MMKKNFNGTYRKMSNNNKTVFKTDLRRTVSCSRQCYAPNSFMAIRSKLILLQLLDDHHTCCMLPMAVCEVLNVCKVWNVVSLTPCIVPSSELLWHDLNKTSKGALVQNTRPRVSAALRRMETSVRWGNAASVCVAVFHELPSRGKHNKYTSAHASGNRLW